MAALPISDIIKQAAVSLGLQEPTGTVFSSSDRDIKQLLQFAVDTGRFIRSQYILPNLKKNYSLTLTSGTNQYLLPADFFSMISGTQWDQSNSWMIQGPLSDQEWNALTYGIVSAITQKRFRIFGANTNTGQIFITPTPGAADVISFDYTRTEWFFPKIWTASESVTSGTTYRSSNGNIYLAQTTATTGATAPSHTTGTASDGTVSWLYVVGQIYSSTGKFLADTDFPLIDDDLILMGVIWRYLKRKGLDYAEDKALFQKECSKRMTRMPGAPLLNMSDSGLRKLMSYDNIPEGSWD